MNKNMVFGPFFGSKETPFISAPNAHIQTQNKDQTNRFSKKKNVKGFGVFRMCIQCV